MPRKKKDSIIQTIDKDEVVHDSSNIQEDNNVLIRFLLDKTLRYLLVDLEKTRYIPVESVIFNNCPQIIQLLNQCYCANNKGAVDQVTGQLNEILSFFHKLEN